MEKRQSLLDRPRLRDRYAAPDSILSRRSASGQRTSALPTTTFGSSLSLFGSTTSHAAAIRPNDPPSRTSTGGSTSASASAGAAAGGATAGASSADKGSVWGKLDFAPKLQGWTEFTWSPGAATSSTSKLAQRAAARAAAAAASAQAAAAAAAPAVSHGALASAAASAVSVSEREGSESMRALSRKVDEAAEEELRRVQEALKFAGIEEEEEEEEGGAGEELEPAPVQEDEEDQLDDESLARKVAPEALQELEDELLRVVSGSLMREPKLHSPGDPVRAHLLELLSRIGPSDPEFVLKAALYAREELNIRTTANFLLAAAASIPPCRRHLRRYLRAAVRLPSDWLDVAALYHTLPHEGAGRVGALPASLRRALAAKFGDFDSYQLAKYNKEKSIKKKNKKAKEAEAKRAAAAPAASGSESGGEGSGGEGKGPGLGLVAAAVARGEKPTLTLKRMIRVLHIDSPAEAVLSILGKRYPASEEAFAGSGLYGEWKAERAGKRMKLPTPETWETKLSATGNKAETWEGLIDARALPFMAMLRNLRNLILTGVSQRHHRWAMSRLTDETTVANSRQLPTSFLSAYEVLGQVNLHEIAADVEEAKKQAKKAKKAAAECGGWVMVKPDAKKGAGKRGGRGGAAGKGERGARPRKVFIPKVMPTEQLLDDYRSALDTAVRIATRRNVPPIGGSTVVLVDVSPDMQGGCKSARGLGAAKRSLADVGLLLGLMCTYVCEDCEFMVFGKEGVAPCTVGDDTVLANWEAVRGDYDLMRRVGAHGCDDDCGAFPFGLLEGYLAERRKIDNLIVLSRRMIAPGFAEGCNPDRDGRLPDPASGGSRELEEAVLGVSNWLEKFRRLVNPRLLYVAVDLLGATPRRPPPQEEKPPSPASGTGSGSSSSSGSGSESEAEEAEAEAEAEEAGAGRPAGRNANDVLVTGFSEAVLKFIAERGGAGGGQLDYVHRIDSVKGLTRAGMLKGKADRRDRKREAARAQQAAASAQGASGAGGEEWRPASIAMRDLISYFRSLKAAAAASAALPAAVPAARGGGGAWRTAAVFVSSTFVDMHGEREALVKRVFPELRERCAARRLRLFEIDLRWGVTGEDLAERSPIEVCLEQVDRCRPLFLGILGQRYGYCPEAYAAPDEARYDWLKSLPPGRSITELEMRHAAIARHNPRACFFFRSPAYLSSAPAELRRGFEAESPEAALRLAALKQALRKRCPGRVTEDYPCTWAGVLNGLPQVGALGAFEAGAREQLWAALDAEFPELEAGEPDEVLAEREPHEALRDARAGPDAGFVGRADLLERLVEGYALAGPDRAVLERPVLAVEGRSGCGKTSLLAAAATRFRAHWAARAAKRRGKALCVFHAVGAGEGAAAADARRLLRRICLEIARWCGADEGSVPHEWRALQEALVRYAQLAALHTGESKRVLIVIDGLDALDEAHRARLLTWLPASLPVPCIVSAAPDGPDAGAALEALRRRRPAPPLVPVGPMPLEERRALVRAALGRYRKRLQEGAEGGGANEMDVLAKKLDADKPLYLAVACEELRCFGSFEGLREKLQGLPGTLQRLLEDAFARLEADVEPSLAPAPPPAPPSAPTAPPRPRRPRPRRRRPRRAAARLAAARFAPLLRALRPFLRETPGPGGEPRLSLFHPLAEAAVRRRYLRGSDTSPQALAVHGHLAAHFLRAVEEPDEGAGRGERRGLAEAARHLARARAWGELEALLTDVAFVRRKCAAGMLHDLLDDYADALRLGGGPAGAGFDAEEDGPVGGFSRFSAVSQAAAAASAAAAANAFSRAACGRVCDFARFVRANAHILGARPHLALQLAANWPEGTAPAEAAAAALAAEGGSWVEHANKPVRTDPCRATLPAHRDGVLCCAFDPAGRRLAAAGRDGAVRIFCTRTGPSWRPRRRTPPPCTPSPSRGPPRGASWRPGAAGGARAARRRPRRLPGGELLASASWDASVRVWDLAAGECVATLRAPGDKPVNAVAWSPDGLALATGAWDGCIRLWAVATEGRVGAGEAESLLGHTRAVRALGFCPSDPALFASLGLDGALLLWRRGVPTPHVRLAAGGPRPGLALRFSPDGRELAAAFEEAAAPARLWDAAGARQVALFPPRSPPPPLWRPSARPLPRAAAGRKRAAVAALVLLPAHEAVRLQAHAAPLSALAASPSEGLLLVGAADGHARLWRLVGGGCGCELLLEPGALLPAHAEAVNACAFDASGALFATGSADTTARVFSAAVEPHAGAVSALAFAPRDLRSGLAGGPRPGGSWGEEEEAAILAAGARDGSVVVWDWRRRRRLARLQPHWDLVTALAFAPGDSGVLLTASWEGKCSLTPWGAGGRTVDLAGHGGPVTAAAFSPDGAAIATGEVSGELRLYFAAEVERAAAAARARGEEGEEAGPDAYRGQALAGHAGAISALAFGPDSLRLFSAAQDGTVRGWTLAPGSGLGALAGHSGPVRGLAYGPDAALATASEDGTLRLWEASGGQQEAPAHLERVTAVALSPDARTLASVSPDGRGAALTDATTGELLRLLPLPAGAGGRAARLESVAWSADGALPYGGAGAPREAPVAALAATPDGRWLVASWARRVELWQPEERSCRLELAWSSFPALDWVVDVAARPAGCRGPFALLAASHDGRLRAWREPEAGGDEARPDVLLPPLSGPGAARGPARPLACCAMAEGRFAAAFTLDGHLLAADLEKQTLFCGAEPLVPAPPSGPAVSRLRLLRARLERDVGKKRAGRGAVAVSVLDMTLAAACGDGWVRVWRARFSPVVEGGKGAQHEGRGLEAHEGPPQLLAEFATRAACTALDAAAGPEGGPPLLAAGDSLGHVYALRLRGLDPDALPDL
eukprot:tig00020961_g16760.t1